ncbi:hypothetical protein HU200_045433 [Digitaria exilis]|uniref:Uncharacterized protein n=1 Tax=Digitaria exilis TaxID=1010633 RepID=A0A835BBK5_9POAL|nr:hypothetical protein HU200_045433 [Digitaria exilis]
MGHKRGIGRLPWMPR